MILEQVGEIPLPAHEVTSYGGPAIMGIMKTELQEKRQWVSRDRFLEGLSLVNILPDATATQLGIWTGHGPLPGDGTPRNRGASSDERIPIRLG
jgi:hypothetical protein